MTGPLGVSSRPSTGDPTLVVVGILGVVVGAGVLAFDRVVWAVLDEVRGGPDWLGVVAPAVGLSLTALVLWVGKAFHDHATTDEYLRSMNEPGYEVAPRRVVTKLVAAATSVGLGVPLGLEGPSVLLGTGAVGVVQRAIPERWRDRVDPQALLVAGAAAAVAAIFKAPATGAVFALEVPFTRDLARHQLLPALTGAATGYLVFAAAEGTEPLFSVVGSPPFDSRDLFGAALLGVAAGLLARSISASIRWAKHQAARPRWSLGAASALVLVGGAWIQLEVADQPIGIGPGYLMVEWLRDPDLATATVALVLGLRLVTVVGATAGGAVGGYFVPLVVMGAGLGRLVGGIFGGATLDLFPIVGIAAVLGAGYQVPLAAVMFVAETSGRPGFVVPALIAAVAADLAAGHTSITVYQREFADR